MADVITEKLTQKVSPVVAVTQAFNQTMQNQGPLGSSGMNSAPFDAGFAGADQYFHDA
jgi:hypothetical protein